MRSDEETFSHWLNQIQNSKIEYYLPSKIPDPPYDGPSPLPNVRLVDQNENYPEGFLLEDIIQLEMMAKNDKHIGNKMKLVGERHMATTSSSIIWKGKINSRYFGIYLINFNFQAGGMGTLPSNLYQKRLKIQPTSNMKKIWQ